jgi:hypothetical protein
MTVLKRQQTGSPVLHWAIRSFGFLFMAADEAFFFHEMLITPVRKLLGDHNLGVLLFRLGYSWHRTRTGSRPVVPGGHRLRAYRRLVC